MVVYTIDGKLFLQQNREKYMRPIHEIFEKMHAAIIERQNDFSELNAIYKFILDGPKGGTWIVDLRTDSIGVRESEEEAQCTIKSTDNHFLNLVNGKLGPERALLTGKIKIQGDIGLAMQLGNLFKL